MQMPKLNIGAYNWIGIQFLKRFVSDYNQDNNEI